MGNPAQSQDFFASCGPDSHVICDPDQSIYQAFGIGRGSLAQMFAPKVFACGIRAMSKGNGVGKPVGDVWQMPAYILIDNNAIIDRYDPKHAGDHPDFERFRPDFVTN